MIPGPLIVSITSHPPRYSHLHLALASLLCQSHKPDAFILWLSPQESEALPGYLTSMPGVVFRTCEDIGPYKSIVPALQEYPDAYIVIAADDVIYPRSWLKRFVDEYRSDNEILCQYAKRITLTDGAIDPSESWPRITKDEAGPFVFPVGVRGVFYPPRSLDPEVKNADAFMRLAPRGDDIWKYWMALRAGSMHRHIRPHELFQDLPTSASGLYKSNRHGGNDEQIAAMVEAYGLPWHQQEAAA